MMNRVLLVSLGVLFCASSPARAFHEVSSFSRTANTGGGAGFYFTGSSRFKNYDCRICHNDGPQTISIGLASQPPELVAEGQYQLGAEYTITVELIGEHRGLESAFNPNTFTAEFLDADGRTLGALGTTLDTVVELASDDTIAIAEGFGRGETSWSFAWTAPASATSGTFHIALLDGDGANDADRRFIDPFNDDVAIRSIAICPLGEVCEVAPATEDPKSPAGCGVASNGAGELVVATLLFLLCTRRRRWRWRLE